MSSSPVNRCIAIAAHGRRCQQSTYRGGPYCWHHTQSRKVWAPSRAAARPRATETPLLALATEESPAAAPAIDRVASHLNRGQLEQLARFLEAPGDGTFVINRAHGYVEVRGWAQGPVSATRTQARN